MLKSKIAALSAIALTAVAVGVLPAIARQGGPSGGGRAGSGGATATGHTAPIHQMAPSIDGSPCGLIGCTGGGGSGPSFHSRGLSNGNTRNFASTEHRRFTASGVNGTCIDPMCRHHRGSENNLAFFRSRETIDSQCANILAGGFNGTSAQRRYCRERGY